MELDEDEENVKYEETTTVSGHPYYIKVNRLANVVTIYTQDDEGFYTIPYKAMVCSVGLNDGTPVGTFRTSTKYRWRALFGNVYGQYAYRIKGPMTVQVRHLRLLIP